MDYSEKWLRRSGRMWWRLAGTLEKAAYEAAERGHRSTALDFARAADACFWQATGEGDAISIKDVAAA